MAIVSSEWQLKLDVTEDLVLDSALASSSNTRHRIESDNGNMTPSSTPAVSKVYSAELQLTAGTVTIDLTALTDAAGAAMDFTGLKVQQVKIVAGPVSGTANTAAIVVADGATNGYTLFGDASGQVTLGPGAQAMCIFNEHLPDVAAGAKTIDVTSTDPDAKFQIILVAG